MADTEAQDAPPNDGDDGQPSPATTRKKPQCRKRGKRTSPVKRGGVTVDRSAPLHQARVFAMQALFEDDLTGHGLDEILARMGDDEDEAIPEQVAAHAARLARGVQTRQSEIDPHIEGAAPAFPIVELASIDRAVLRIAVYELLFEPDVPFKAAINEAVEIAKRYGGPGSGRFVNGVMRTISERLHAARES